MNAIRKAFGFLRKISGFQIDVGQWSNCAPLGKMAFEQGIE